MEEKTEKTVTNEKTEKSVVKEKQVQTEKEKDGLSPAAVAGIATISVAGLGALLILLKKVLKLK